MTSTIVNSIMKNYIGTLVTSVFVVLILVTSSVHALPATEADVNNTSPDVTGVNGTSSEILTPNVVVPPAPAAGVNTTVTAVEDIGGEEGGDGAEAGVSNSSDALATANTGKGDEAAATKLVEVEAAAAINAAAKALAAAEKSYTAAGKALNAAVAALNATNDGKTAAASNDSEKEKEKQQKQPLPTQITGLSTEEAFSTKMGGDKRDEENPFFSMETFTIIFITLLIVVTNCGILIVAATTEAFVNFNLIFMFSLTAADLLIGVLITPYSIFLSVYRRWVFTSNMFCSVEAYVFAALISAKIYSLTWLNVDHYVAVRKPERYNVMMSSTRSFCWICFSWVIAASFCGPPLFSLKSAVFNEATFICQVDTVEQKAYLITALLLVFGPAQIAIFITSGYLCTKSFAKRINFYEKVFVELSTRPSNYRMTSIQCAIFFVLWTPFNIITFVKAGGYYVIPELEFCACWLGMCSSFSHFIVLLVMSNDFREAVLELCAFPAWCKICQPKRRQDDAVRVNIIKVKRSNSNPNNVKTDRAKRYVHV